MSFCAYERDSLSSFDYFCERIMDKRKYIYIALPISIALVIVYLCCLLPPNDIPEIDSPFPFPIDKLVHFLMYVGFAGAIFLAYTHLTIKSKRFNYLAAFFWCLVTPILFGGLIEIIQAKYCPGRSGDWLDLLADALGSLFIIPLAVFYKRFLEKRNDKK
jgi:VanZ family protein